MGSFSKEAMRTFGSPLGMFYISFEKISDIAISIVSFSSYFIVVTVAHCNNDLQQLFYIRVSVDK